MSHISQTSLASADRRRAGYRQNIPFVFGATAALYYDYWGDYFHFAIFDGEAEQDFNTALERTHERYFRAIRGPDARRILELATGGGAFAHWMTDHGSAEILGIDISDAQLLKARARLAKSPRPGLRFVEHDIMRVSELDEPLFDAAVCLDAACYLPDKPAALRSIASRLAPGARFLLVDWCRSEVVAPLQEELILEPFYRAWGIPGMETMSSYRKAFAAAGFRLLEVEDLTPRVQPNWERAYRAAISAIASVPPQTLLRLAASAVRYGPGVVQLAKDQFAAALLIKAAADSGILRYVLVLAEREA